MCGVVVQVLLLLAITMRTNWDKEVGKSKPLPCIRIIPSGGFSASSNFSSVGSQGKGQSLQFVPTSRHDDMSMEQRCRIALGQDQDASWANEIRNSSGIWLPLCLHVTSMAVRLPRRKRHPTSDLYW